MWQTPRSRQTQRAPRRGTQLGLFACIVAVLLIGVVIGRVTARNGNNEVYLYDAEPTRSAAARTAKPTAKATASRYRNRPPLDPVVRTQAPVTGELSSKPRPLPTRSTMIEGSNNGTLWHTSGPNDLETIPQPANPDAYLNLEKEVVRLVNAERAKVRCTPLRIDPRLVQSARLHSAAMARSNRLSHTAPDGSSPWERMAAVGYPNSGAETIARGYGSADEVVRGWMANPGDRRSLLNCQLVATGVGVSMGSGGLWWTEDFGYS